jgi:hypothetical protein
MIRFVIRYLRHLIILFPFHTFTDSLVNAGEDNGLFFFFFIFICLNSCLKVPFLSRSTL